MKHGVIICGDYFKKEEEEPQTGQWSDKQQVSLQKELGMGNILEGTLPSFFYCKDERRVMYFQTYNILLMFHNKVRTTTSGPSPKVDMYEIAMRITYISIYMPLIPFQGKQCFVEHRQEGRNNKAKTLQV